MNTLADHITQTLRGWVLQGMLAPGERLEEIPLAQKLGVKPGVYTHTIANAHVYDIHYDAAQEMIGRTPDMPKASVKLPKDTFARAEAKDTALVEDINNSLAEHYQPGEAIKGLRIVL